MNTLSMSKRSLTTPRWWFDPETRRRYRDDAPLVPVLPPAAPQRLSVERDDDLAVGAALLDVRQRLEGVVERERLVDERAEVAGVVEGGQLAQLRAVGLHEQKRVAHAELPGLLADLAAQQPHHDAHRPRGAELFREPGVRRAGHADRLSARPEDGEGPLEVLAPSRVQHDVIAGEDLGEVLFGVVHNDVGAEAAHQFRVLAPRGRRDCGAEVLGELDDGRPQAAGAGVDEDLLAG